jgi:hypothetical protein
MASAVLRERKLDNAQVAALLLMATKLNTYLPAFSRKVQYLQLSIWI